MARRSIAGVREFRARMKALKLSPEPMGRDWAEKTTEIVRPMVPVRTGKGRMSVQPGRGSNARRAFVVGTWYLRFTNRGAKAHTIQPKSVSGSKRGGVGTVRMLKFEKGGNTIFARQVKHPGIRRKNYGGKSARKALKAKILSLRAIEEWNKAA